MDCALCLINWFLCEFPKLALAAWHKAAGLVRQRNSEKTVYKTCIVQLILSLSIKLSWSIRENNWRFCPISPFLQLQLGDVGHVVLQREDLRRRDADEGVPHRGRSLHNHYSLIYQEQEVHKILTGGVDRSCLRFIRGGSWLAKPRKNHLH